MHLIYETSFQDKIHLEEAQKIDYLLHSKVDSKNIYNLVDFGYKYLRND